MENGAQQRVIDTSVAASLAGVSYETMRRWADLGVLPQGVAYKLVGRWKYNRAALVAWLDSHKQPAQGELTF